MTDNKILQAILDRVMLIHKELNDFKKEVNERFERLDKKIDENGKRIDKLGMQISSLEDDSPTVREFDNLEKRVSHLETLTLKN